VRVRLQAPPVVDAPAWVQAPQYEPYAPDTPAAKPQYAPDAPADPAFAQDAPDVAQPGPDNADAAPNAGEIGPGARGQAGRFPARGLPSALHRQDFLPTRHFLERLLERAQRQGVRFDPRAFGRAFAQAPHYRQTRPGYNTRIAVVRGLPILYRVGGENGNRIVLVGMLPEGALPPAERIRPPQLSAQLAGGGELLGELGAAPPSRGSRDHTRWAQRALNQILGLRLATDGVMGPATRSAIRSFQQRQKLKADSIIGPQTEAALRAALGGRLQPASSERCTVLDGFAFNRDELTAAHQQQLAVLVRQLLASRGSALRIVGHTDPVGNASYNLQLGRRRAERVAQRLRAAMEQIRRGSTRQVAFTVESRGEQEPVSRDAARNRRVQICYSAAGGACVIAPLVRPDAELTELEVPAPPPASPAPPIARPCCMLAPQQSLRANGNLLEPGRLGKHNLNEDNGLIYTAKAGFIDFGHIREICDQTKFIYDQLTTGVTPFQVVAMGTSLLGQPVVLGEAKMLGCPVDPLHVARSISYDVGLGHEIITYDVLSPGGHNSSFSPEDLCSNYLGTLVAARAIKAGGNFNDAVTAELDKLVRDLGGMSKAESRKAFDRINGVWVDWSDTQRIASLRNDDYLKRRNFGRAPFKTGHPGDQPTPAYVVESFRDLHSVYRYTHKEGGKNIARSSYDSEIQRIKADAKKRYGDKFDQP